MKKEKNTEHQQEQPTAPTKLYKRIRIGRPPKFESAEDLMNSALGYFEWCDNSPFLVNVRRKVKRTNKGSDQEQTQEPVARPYTLDGLCIWLNILVPWATFKRDCMKRKDGEDFSIVIDACEKTIRDQQVSGALIGIYSERLTARLNGISEKVETVSEVKSTMSWEDLREKMRHAVEDSKEE